ncbi:helix-turn-helix domain-containing protein [Hydrogenophaga sp. SL48]|nr:helix-turn-helix domain-containing protein [Hydrogenophaga sp. SL48]
MLASTGGNRQTLLQEINRLLRSETTSAREAVELHLLAAELHVQADQQRLALRALNLAIARAARRRLLHPFLERHATVARILAGLSDKALSLTQPDEIALLAQWRERTAPDSTQDRPVATIVAGPPVEAPTTRELQMLELLAQGLSNQQIADRMTLSLPTVKWHLTNLYGKLRVKSRATALVRARALQLLAP